MYNDYVGNGIGGFMAGRIITLKYDGTCRACGAHLKAGEQATWYGKGIVYGKNCHKGNQKIVNGKIGWVSTGSDGKEYYQNYNGRCEDAPCCGCCNC
jgi:hypothetical protein